MIFSEYALLTCQSEAQKWWCCYSWWFSNNDNTKSGSWPWPKNGTCHILGIISPIICFWSISLSSSMLSIANVAWIWRWKSVVSSRQHKRPYAGEYLGIICIGLRCVLYSGRHVFGAQLGRYSVNVDQSRILWDFTRLLKGIGKFRIGNKEMYVTLWNCSVWLMNNHISRYMFVKNYYRIMR